MGNRYGRIETGGSASHRSNFAFPNSSQSQYQEQQYHHTYMLGHHPMPPELLQGQDDPRQSNQPPPWQQSAQMNMQPSHHQTTAMEDEIEEDDGRLRAVRDLPPAFRSLFTFKYFNTVQSSCFAAAYESDINMVVSAPTGSGKVSSLTKYLKHPVQCELQI